MGRFLYFKFIMNTVASEWNTVNRRKNKDKSSKRGKNEKGKKKNSRKRINYSFFVDTNKVYFLPTNMIKDINALFTHGFTAHDFMRKLVDICHPRNYHWNSCVVYVIHEASSRDKLELMEFILNTATDRTKIANSKCGPLEFTPIFKSAYKGSIRALKMLLCAGADLSIQNKLGETVMQALEQGNIDSNKKSPEFKIFNDERYRECRQFLQNWNPDRERPVQDEDFQAYVPPNMRNRDKSDEKKANDEEESFSEYSIDDFLENFQNRNHVRDFFNEKNVEEICTTIIEAAEKGNLYFEKLISFYEVIDKPKLKSAFSSPELIEYVKFDAPFTKNKLNEICDIFGISKF